ncbi:type II toxin-antitoxin system VapC family toxin [Rhodoferax aquaticus]|uniref:Uncharacterized protein n=1 Tax=Rhodoferax aquaticus TaxID=2527691 RepID=A0A515EP75_9BURK|nr:type II toxin-antitoxin system VapC family toxin [Rhodoferax aquaticus]QDL54430.1 hypothetical protein EXZ61_09780 [Rhodoferax aquaticus]
MPARDHCVVSSIVQLALYKGAKARGGEDRADQLVAYTPKCHVEPLEMRIALRAPELHQTARLCTFAFIRPCFHL